MNGPVFDAGVDADGSFVIRVHGAIDQEHAVELRQLLVHTIGKVRPLRLILDVADVGDLDPVNLASVVAACVLGDDHRVAVFVINAPLSLAGRLISAGVPPHRIRDVVSLPSLRRREQVPTLV